MTTSTIAAAAAATVPVVTYMFDPDVPDGLRRRHLQDVVPEERELPHLLRHRQVLDAVDLVRRDLELPYALHAAEGALPEIVHKVSFPHIRHVRKDLFFVFA